MLKKLGLKENESIDHPWINKAMENSSKNGNEKFRYQKKFN